MKIKNSKIIVAALSLGLILSACGNNDTKTEDKEEKPATESTDTTTEDTKADDTKDEDAKTEDTANAEDYDFAVVSREEGSGTRGAFIELVGLEEKKDDGSKEDHTTVDALSLIHI